MSARFFLYRFAILLLAILQLPSLASGAAPEGALPPQLLDIPSSARVEGSLARGGIQPDYLIDFDDPAWDHIKRRVDYLCRERIGLLPCITSIQSLIQTKLLPGRSYTQKRYLAMLAAYKAENEPVPLSAYFRTAKAGVCREYAMYTHLLLKHAGYDNRFVYSFFKHEKWDQPQRKDRRLMSIEEDHAFVVIRAQPAPERKGSKIRYSADIAESTIESTDLWIIDTYDPGLNGFRLTDMRVREIYAQALPNLFRSFSGQGAGSITSESYGRRRILTIHNFPRLLHLDDLDAGAGAAAPAALDLFEDEGEDEELPADSDTPAALRSLAVAPSELATPDGQKSKREE